MPNELFTLDDTLSERQAQAEIAKIVTNSNIGAPVAGQWMHTGVYCRSAYGVVINKIAITNLDAAAQAFWVKVHTASAYGLSPANPGNAVFLRDRTLDNTQNIQVAASTRPRINLAAATGHGPVWTGNLAAVGVAGSYLEFTFNYFLGPEDVIMVVSANANVNYGCVLSGVEFQGQRGRDYYLARMS